MHAGSRMANDGLRVLGVARASFKQSIALPSEQHDFAFSFLGFVGLADPVRPKVADAVKECDTAGIRVVMITGDYPATAQQIARQIGLDEACLPGGLRPLGAISLRDTLRPEARETLAQFVALGVQIKIISGDHPQTVVALAKQVGLDDTVQI